MSVEFEVLAWAVSVAVAVVVGGGLLAAGLLVVASAVHRRVQNRRLQSEDDTAVVPRITGETVVIPRVVDGTAPEYIEVDPDLVRPYVRWQR